MSVDQPTARPWPHWCCPAHQVPLAQEEQVLTCAHGHSFPVRSRVPRFISGSTYADAFGAQWKRYRQTQLDSYSGTTISRDRTKRCLGESLWQSLAGLDVLECGCGAGRFTEVLLAQGARVTSIDLSDAVEANEENFPQTASHRVGQADIRALPFAGATYDVVFCLGVLQHTPEPNKAIECLYRFVRPGGTLVFDHYGYSLSWQLRVAPLVRLALIHLAPDRGLRATERLVEALLPFHRILGRSRWSYTLLTRLSPITSYYHAYPELTPQLHREWALLDTHDSLTDRYKHFRTVNQIQRLLLSLGAEDIRCTRAGNGVEARARKPTT